MRAIFIAADGRLRPIWRALLFFVLAYWVLPLGLDPVFNFLASRWHIAAEFTAANIGLQESENLVIALACTALFARYEQWRIDS